MQPLQKEADCWSNAKGDAAKSAKKIEKKKKNRLRKHKKKIYLKMLPRKNHNLTVRLKIAQMNHPQQ